MSFKPMLFSTADVQAIMDGRKTMTRRIINGASPHWNFLSLEDGSALSMIDKDGNECPRDVEGLWATFESEGYVQFPMIKCPYEIGDVLWVRETWQYAYDTDDATDQCIEETGRYLYCADNAMPFTHWVDPDTGEHKQQMPWRPSIFMPREACRLFLRVIGVRDERLQEITSTDAVHEGIARHGLYNAECYAGGCYNGDFENTCAICKVPREGFHKLWDSLNSKRGYGWDTNPFVWVYTFERCEKPEGWCK